MIQIARALVEQRQGLSALAGITFSFDPQIATLDVFPRSLISVKTPGKAFRGFAVVPFDAMERVTLNPEDQEANDLESMDGLLTRSVISAPLYMTRACRIHSQDRGPETITLVDGSRESVITWGGYASFDFFPTFTLSAAADSVGAAGVTGSTFSVTTSADGAWLAVSTVGWITVSSGAGPGSGAVTYSVAVNVGTSRTGTITVRDKTFTVTQAAA